MAVTALKTDFGELDTHYLIETHSYYLPAAYFIYNSYPTLLCATFYRKIF